MTQKDPWGDEKIDIKLPNLPKMPKVGASAFVIIIVIIFAVWVGTGFFSVKADQMAVVKRFGKIVKIVGSGLHFHLPFPIETIDRAEVTKIHRVEVGFRTIRNGQFKSVPKESLMLTGDENIVSIDLIVQYKIFDIKKFLYNVVDVRKTIKDVTESAIREVAGKEKIDDLLTTGKSRIQTETLNIIQAVLNEYNTGVKVVAVQLQDVEPPRAVVDSFKDVASAKEDKSRFINEAESYANEIIPRARAKAASMILEAEAYQAEKTEKAKGDTTRFLEVLNNYKAAPDITKKRLYLETMSNVLKNKEKLIFDSQIKNVNPFVGLDNLMGGRK